MVKFCLRTICKKVDCSPLWPFLKDFFHASAGEFETKELCARFMTNVVATCAFGVNGNAIKNPESEFRRMGRNMIEPNYWKNVKITIILLVPWIADLFNLR